MTTQRRLIHRVLAQPSQALGNLGVVDSDHAALTAGDHLARVKREAGEWTERADRTPPVAGSDRARRILDEYQAIAIGEVEEAIHVSRKTDLVNRHDCLCRWCQPSLDIAWVQVAGDRIDVGEDRRRAAMPDGVCSCDERQRWHDHLITGTYSGCMQSQMESRRAACRGHGFRRADPLREGKFKLLDAWSLGQPAGGNDLGHGFGLPAEPRSCKGNLHQVLAAAV